MASLTFAFPHCFQRYCLKCTVNKNDASHTICYYIIPDLPLRTQDQLIIR